jgi:hypothetical protein
MMRQGYFNKCDLAKFVFINFQSKFLMNFSKDHFHFIWIQSDYDKYYLNFAFDLAKFPRILNDSKFSFYLFRNHEFLYNHS